MQTMWNTSFRGKAHLKCSYWSREAGSGSDGQKCRCKMLWYWPKRWLRSEPLIRTKTDIVSEPVTDRLKSQHNSCWISVFSCTFFITNLLWNESSAFSIICSLSLGVPAGEEKKRLGNRFSNNCTERGGRFIQLCIWLDFNNMLSVSGREHSELSLRRSDDSAAPTLLRVKLYKVFSLCSPYRCCPFSFVPLTSRAALFNGQNTQTWQLRCVSDDVSAR